MVETIIGKTKREGQRKAKGQITHRNQKKGKELVHLVVGNYVIHNPFNVIYMQIMKSNNNGRFKTSITRQHNLPLYNIGESMLKNNIIMSPKKLNAKRQGQMTSRSSIVEKTNTLPNEMIHITPKCIVHLRGH